MDRRDALKKLGMGGATIAGASLVISSPAFAAFTVNPVPPTVTVTTAGSEKSATFTMSQPNPTCGGSAVAPGPSRTSTFTTGAITAQTASFSPVGGTLVASTTLSVTAGGSAKFVADDTATITITTNFVCPYRRQNGTTCRVYTFRFTYVEGGTKNFVLNTGNPTVETC